MSYLLTELILLLLLCLNLTLRAPVRSRFAEYLTVDETNGDDTGPFVLAWPCVYFGYIMDTLESVLRGLMLEPLAGTR